MKNEYKNVEVNPLSVSRFNKELDLYITLKKNKDKKKNKEDKINQATICKKLGISEQYMIMLKKGERRLTLDLAEKFGELFKVYPRYLLGLSDERRYTKQAFQEETKLLLKRDRFIGDCLEYFGYEFLSYEHRYYTEECNDNEVIGAQYVIKTPEDTTVIITDTKLNELADEIIDFIRIQLSHL